ncbi:MAG TPA: DUF6789 family protein [Gammaproteobacteria bacterium]
MNNKLKSGIIAGFVATLVISTLSLLTVIMGLIPPLDTVLLLSSALAVPVLVGWMIHFVIGAMLWGFGFGAFYTHLPGRSMAAKGTSLGVVVWLLMGLIVMPMAGVGLMGLDNGLMTPFLSLILHLIFGLVLGTSFVRIYSELSSIQLSSASSSTLYHR